jgi:hypothetical protein
LAIVVSTQFANLARRRLYLILLDNEGLTYRLDVKNQPGGDAGRSNIPLTADAGSAGSNRVSLAVVSDAAHRDPGKTSPRAPAIHRWHSRSRIRRATASVGADYFKFVD